MIYLVITIVILYFLGAAAIYQEGNTSELKNEDNQYIVKIVSALIIIFWPVAIVFILGDKLFGKIMEIYYND